LKKPGTKTITSCARGIYEEDSVKRQEVISFIQMS
ncbi:MAG: GTP cyclohydrolase I FolE, partial [Lysinibacillus sp.]|nr:GTP cyclohydrolase I FolE [Lysinibacillus sp.]